MKKKKYEYKTHTKEAQRVKFGYRLREKKRNKKREINYKQYVTIKKMHIYLTVLSHLLVTRATKLNSLKSLKHLIRFLKKNKNDPNIKAFSVHMHE